MIAKLHVLLFKALKTGLFSVFNHIRLIVLLRTFSFPWKIAQRSSQILTHVGVGAAFNYGDSEQDAVSSSPKPP